jgi:cold shock protein
MSDDLYGRVATWNEDRGYGFIEPDGGGEDVFCHVSALPAGLDTVLRGTRVQFEKEPDLRGRRARAVNVRLLDEPPARSAAAIRSQVRYGE